MVGAGSRYRDQDRRRLASGTRCGTAEMSAAGPHRLPQGGRIDRSRPLSFALDGKAVNGFKGDTLASALFASGPRLVGRSFKYPWPRGLLDGGIAAPTALL